MDPNQTLDSIKSLFQEEEFSNSKVHTIYKKGKIYKEKS